MCVSKVREREAAEEEVQEGGKAKQSNREINLFFSIAFLRKRRGWKDEINGKILELDLRKMLKHIYIF